MDETHIKLSEKIEKSLTSGESVILCFAPLNTLTESADVQRMKLECIQLEKSKGVGLHTLKLLEAIDTLYRMTGGSGLKMWVEKSEKELK